MKILPAEAFQGLLSRAFERMGTRPEDAAEVAASLVRASLCGFDSHGVFRLVQYHETWKQGLLNPAARPSIVTTRCSLAKAASPSSTSRCAFNTVFW